MFVVRSEITDPFFNLALEDYFLTHCQDNYLLLYRNECSVIVGRNQNLFKEVNLPYIQQNKVRLARRITGGGTVFHDKGNLNFAFIENMAEKGKINYERYLNPLIAFLKMLGIDASLMNKNSIVTSAGKVSGNAQHVHKERVLHHGTMLLNADMTFLKNTLHYGQRNIQDKAVASVPMKTKNLFDFFEEDWHYDRFVDALTLFLSENGFNLDYEFNLDAIDSALIRKRQEWLCSWKWVFARSPQFELTARLPVNKHDHLIMLHVEKGIIRFVKGEHLNKNEKAALKQLEGNVFLPHRVEQVLHDQPLLREKKDEIIQCFFG